MDLPIQIQIVKILKAFSIRNQGICLQLTLDFASRLLE